MGDEQAISSDAAPGTLKEEGKRALVASAIMILIVMGLIGAIYRDPRLAPGTAAPSPVAVPTSKT